jgi:hypothetical protein
VRIGVQPQLLSGYHQGFTGVTLDDGCARPACLIRFCDNTTIGINSSTITGVRRVNATGLKAMICVVGSTRVVLRNSSISSNDATAAITAQQAWLHVFGSTFAANTVYDLAGGILAVNNSIVVVDGGSAITGNTVSNASGGGVIVADQAVFVLSGASRVVNNTCLSLSGGGVGVLGSAQARIEGKSIVCNNTSLLLGGGGIVAAGHGELALVGDSVVCNNTGGFGAGGLMMMQNATVTIRNASISGNVAHGSGGGVGVTDHGFLAVFDSVIANNTSLEDPRGGLGGGGVVASDNAVVHLFNGTKLLGNRAVGMIGGAFALDRAAGLTIAAGVVLFDNSVEPVPSSRSVPFGSDGVAIEASTLDIEPGVIGQDGLLTKCSRSIALFRRPCGVGEFDGGVGSACLCCQAFTYSFDPDVTVCQQCPANAQCRADVVRPVVGYWHSSPMSLQMHKCPISGSCKELGECSAGHMGNLCGQCAQGYGITTPLRCRMCMAPRLQLGVYMSLVGATVVFVTTTVHFTWQDNKTGDRSLRPSDAIKVLVQFLQYVVILGSISVPWPAFLGGVFTAASVVFGVGSGQALSLDCWLPHYLPNKLPLALQRQLSYFVGALVVALACVVLMNLLHVCNRALTACRAKHIMHSRRQQGPRLHFWSRLRVTLLVTAFYAYPTLVRAALSFFACLPIDNASNPTASVRSHKAGYWVGAIQQECFVGWHRPWALGFGLPAVLVLCVGVPVGLFVFLWCSKAKTSDAAFREHYGFLFRNYTESKPWWEAVWAAQTVLLTAISVFHFTIQAYYALLLMQLILLLSAVIQAVARPYAQPLLHRLHLTSSCCLFLVVWLSLALFSGSVVVDSITLGHAHAAVGVIMVAIACGFVMWCVVVIVRVASPWLHGCISSSMAGMRECASGKASCRQLKHPQSSAGQHNHSSQLQAPQGVEQAAGRPWQVLTAYASGV